MMLCITTYINRKACTFPLMRLTKTIGLNLQNNLTVYQDLIRSEIKLTVFLRKKSIKRDSVFYDLMR